MRIHLTIYLITISFSTLFVLLAANTCGQVNRARNKTIIAYDNNYQRASAGTNYSVEIRNGVLWVYGDNKYGQLGDGTNTERLSPVRIGNSNTEWSNWITVSCGGSHTLALKTDGTLWAWGDNNSGQLGDSAFSSSSVPVEIGKPFSWICVDAGKDFSIAIRSDGTLWAWGKNSNGQLGVAGTTNRYRLTQVGNNNSWTAISAGENHSLGVQSDGTLWAWGYNNTGQLGDGTTTQRTSPVKVGSKINWTLISAGYGHSSALQANGSLWSWGDNKYGQLGHGDVSNKNAPVRIGTENVWKGLSAGNFTTHALKCDGTLWACGYNNVGQLGDGTTSSKNTLTKLKSSTDNWVNIQSGGSHSIALKADGTLWTWGNNSNGQLGDSTTTNKTTLIKISYTLNWVSLTTGAIHTFAIKSDGTLWGWGANQIIRDSTFGSTYNAVQIGNENNWIGVVTYVNHHLAIKADGTLWAWGANVFGQLGDGTNITRKFPVQVGSDNNWKHISLGDSQTIALKHNGTLWRWGSNFFWQLGDSVLKGWNYPRQLGTLSDWMSSSTGADFSIVLNANGELFAWGVGFMGQTGDGSTATRYDIHQIANGQFVSISSGPDHTMGLRSDGKIWTWGRGDSGQLGDGYSVNRYLPVLIFDEGKNWISMSSGSFSNQAIAADGKLWGWGYNKSGQLGNRENYNLLTPALNRYHRNIVAVSISNIHSGILKSNREAVCMAGSNFYGQLGIDEGFKDESIIVNNFGCDPQSAFKIVTDSAITSSLCIGSGLRIPFTLVGSYLSELNYTAQLSDSAGQFNNAISIGSVRTIDDDTIVAFIPLNLPPASAYRIRVVADDTLVSSMDNGKDIFIHGLPDTKVLTNGEPMFCEDGFLILEVEQQGNFYQWMKNDVDIDSAVNSIFKVFSTGNYKVKVKSIYGCLDSSQALQLTAIPKPGVKEQPRDTSVLLGEQAFFSVSSAEVNITFQWQLLVGNTYINITNAGPYTGAKSYKLTISNALPTMDGNKYRTLITTSDGCLTYSDPAVLKIKKVGYVKTISLDIPRIYPNPVVDNLTIESKNLIGTEYSLYDILGKTLLFGKMNSEVSILQTGHLAQGIYFLYIGGNNAVTFKVLKY